MDRTKALAVALICVLTSWLVWPMVFDWGVGLELPFIGFLGLKPFEFLNEYFTLIVGFSGVVAMYFMVKKKGE